MPIITAATIRSLAARGGGMVLPPKKNAVPAARRGLAAVATVPKDQVPAEDQDRVIVRDDQTGEPILVALVQGQYYAVEATCPHMNKSLEKGKIITDGGSGSSDGGPEIRCRFHNTRFNLKNGVCTKWVTGALGFDNSIVGGLAQKVGGEKRDLRAYKVITNDENGSLTIDDELAWNQKD